MSSLLLVPCNAKMYILHKILKRARKHLRWKRWSVNLKRKDDAVWRARKRNVNWPSWKVRWVRSGGSHKLFSFFQSAFAFVFWRKMRKRAAVAVVGGTPAVGRQRNKKNDGWLLWSCAGNNCEKDRWSYTIYKTILLLFIFFNFFSPFLWAGEPLMLYLYIFNTHSGYLNTMFSDVLSFLLVCVVKCVMYM